MRFFDVFCILKNMIVFFFMIYWLLKANGDYKAGAAKATDRTNKVDDQKSINPTDLLPRTNVHTDFGITEEGVTKEFVRCTFVCRAGFDIPADEGPARADVYKLIEKCL